MIDADLGGSLVKQRVARPEQGRSGGFRTIIAYRRGKRAIFLHLFAKAQKANLNDAELESLRALAKAYDGLDDAKLNELATKRGWRRIERS